MTSNKEALQEWRNDEKNARSYYGDSIYETIERALSPVEGDAEKALDTLKNAVVFLPNAMQQFRLKDIAVIEHTLSQRTLQEWQPVPGWEAQYLVSSGGLIKRVTGEKIGTWYNDDGYEFVRLANPRSTERVHRIVASAFVANPDGKPRINHIDNNPANNCASNLEWCTQAENMAHMDAQGRRSKYWSGKRSPNSKLDREQVLKIVELSNGGMGQEKIAEVMGSNKKTVHQILTGKSYKWALPTLPKPTDKAEV